MNKSENALTGSLHLSAERLDPQAILFNRRNGDPGKTRTSDTQFRKLLKANRQNLMKSEVCQYVQILAAFSSGTELHVDVHKRQTK